MVENIGNIEKVQPTVPNTPEIGSMHQAVESGLPSTVTAGGFEAQSQEEVVNTVGGYGSPEIKKKVEELGHAEEEIKWQPTDPKKAASWRETFDRKVQGGEISNN